MTRYSASSAANDTPTRLLHTAIALFAEHGLQAVSLRVINEHAGSKNGSAVQYHFGSRDGLLEAIVDYLWTEILQHTIVRLDRLETSDTPPSVRDIVEAIFEPALAYSLRPGIGLAAARLLPRVIEEAPPQIRHRFAERLTGILSRAQILLIQAAPQVPESVLRLRLAFALINGLHLVTDLHVLYGAEDVVNDPDTRVRVYDHFIATIAAGLAAPPETDPLFRRRLHAQTLSDRDAIQ
ncbi:MAG: TetR/AcrR family transcriptional regulator [Candidatus Dadabacteria bacterium]|nr:MAG: TetR/AcrR family transcriptional regulator [Candidatus Dadabacteria bacterium]